MLLCCLLDLRIGKQPMNQRLAPGALERPDANAQACRDVLDDAVGGMRQDPAQRRHDEVLVERPESEQPGGDGEPERNGDRFAHIRARSRAKRYRPLAMTTPAPSQTAALGTSPNTR